jgi:hypothetical protein
MSLVTSTPTKIYRATMPDVIKSRSDERKLASYEVAGIIAKNLRPEGTTESGGAFSGVPSGRFYFGRPTRHTVPG